MSRLVALTLASCLILAAGAAVAGDGLYEAIGERLFKRAWVPAPSSTLANDGLGPLFNARSCLSCHQGLDRMPRALGRAGPVESPHLALRLSDGKANPDPVYGFQLQTSAVQGHRPEGQLRASKGRLALTGLAYGPLSPATRMGGRDAPMLRGLGLIDAVPDAAIVALEDPDDRDGDGVRGRANRLADGRIGRFGWKASTASLGEQVAMAFHLDLGMSTSLHLQPAGDCRPAQSDCLAAPHGGDPGNPEIHPEIIAMLTAYLGAVDAPRSLAKPEDAALFETTGCAACHTPELPTKSGAKAAAFTDLLLHDLGPGLDGGATEPNVAPTQWRTAPLWGMARSLASGGGLLHDGRAASVTQAIAFHGGEGAGARIRFGALSPGERQRLIDYVEGL